MEAWVAENVVEDETIDNYNDNDNNNVENQEGADGRGVKMDMEDAGIAGSDAENINEINENEKLLAEGNGGVDVMVQVQPWEAGLRSLVALACQTGSLRWLCSLKEVQVGRTSATSVTDSIASAMWRLAQSRGVRVGQVGLGLVSGLKV